ncbi:hypothetical protein BSKO_10793 [Bryopsis sp. KO-2023]|nr:hypothetical protein BSKO_10793 [Bryopsis sp. KO-2023]
MARRGYDDGSAWVPPGFSFSRPCPKPSQTVSPWNSVHRDSQHVTVDGLLDIYSLDGEDLGHFSQSERFQPCPHSSLTPPQGQTSSMNSFGSKRGRLAEKQGLSLIRIASGKYPPEVSMESIERAKALAGDNKELGDGQRNPKGRRLN